MKAKIRGTEIYFDISGMQLAPVGNKFVERPVVFMLHGGPGGDHLRFKQHSLELNEVAQLVFIDHRGCGRSKKTKQSHYTLENNAKDVEALRKYLGLKKIIVLGTSYGGMVAQRYASYFPNSVEKLIIVVSAPSFEFLREAKAYLNQYGTKAQIAKSEKLWAGKFTSAEDVAEFFENTDTLYSVKARNNPKRTKHINHTVWSHEAINQAFKGFLNEYDLRPVLSKIKCPTLVLAGEEDWICSKNQSKEIAALIPNAKLKIFKNCGHSIAVDAHDQYINAIKKFITKKI